LKNERAPGQIVTKSRSGRREAAAHRVAARLRKLQHLLALFKAIVSGGICSAGARWMTWAPVQTEFGRRGWNKGAAKKLTYLRGDKTDARAVVMTGRDARKMQLTSDMRPRARGRPCQAPGCRSERCRCERLRVAGAYAVRGDADGEFHATVGRGGERLG
jgi:hypothetical protein